MDNKKTYLVEVTYFDTHNTEVVTITTSDIKKSMNEYQRNRKPLEYEVIDWKRERDSRMLHIGSLLILLGVAIFRKSGF